MPVHDSFLVFCSYSDPPGGHYRATSSLMHLSSFTRPALLLKAFGGDDIPEHINGEFRLCGNFHLARGVVKKVTPVVFAGIPEVIGGAPLIEFHADDTQPSINEVPPGMGHVGHMNAIEDTIGGMGNGLVEAM